jgi:hypothetical protein
MVNLTICKIVGRCATWGPSIYGSSLVLRLPTMVPQEHHVGLVCSGAFLRAHFLTFFGDGGKGHGGFFFHLGN